MERRSAPSGAALGAAVDAAMAAANRSILRENRFASIAGLATLGIGVIVLLGWLLDVEVLKSLYPGLIVMIPNTAVAFVLAGGSLQLQSTERDSRGTVRRVARVAAFIVLVFGVMMFIERVADVSLGIDLLIFPTEVRAYPYLPPGRIATNSAVCFALAGLALLSVDARPLRGWYLTQIASGLGLFISGLALVGYLYGARPLYAIDQAAGMALFTAVGFAALHTGILFARPRRGSIALITGPDLGGQMARRLLPAVFVVPLALGWLWILVRRESLVSLEGAAAIFSLVTIGMLALFSLRSAHALRTADRERSALLRREERARADAERLAERLREQTSELEVANRAKGEFLALMSHELRTPLNAIAGYTELMSLGIRGPVTAQQTQDLDRIRRNGHYLLALINDVLNFARVEAGRIELDPRDFALHDVLDGLEALVGPQLARRAHRYRYAPCGASAWAHADPEKVRQIVLNLVMNAIKFTEPGGDITVGCEPRGDGVDVYVRDTGRGVPPEELERIFTPFVQLDRELTGEGQGTGLGLSISRDLARRMGGDVTVASTPGVGSTFTLVLPAATAHAARPLPPARSIA